jgi:hypothetical protein
VAKPVREPLPDQPCGNVGCSAGARRVFLDAPTPSQMLAS